MNIPQFTLIKSPSPFERVTITSSQAGEAYARQFYSTDIEIYESMFLLMLDRANHTIGYAKISQGGIVGTVVDIKIICKYIVDSLASGVMLFHNHPSGNLHPSQQDRVSTMKVKEAAKMLDSALIDHIILTAEGYYSFADNGVL